jgi:hypothetical protein
VHQTPFQRALWILARDAHAGGDRADARILMRMIEAIDEGDYPTLLMLGQGLRPGYRDRIGPIPGDRSDDVGREGGIVA